ncbi:2-haloacid dehalogenase [Palleronia marisminoris]|uniref:Alpha-D-glucose-1-phosphate phosphatase YihX n=1 Tax=Palleronia marisminoris TaxID=315423 RepID=A0A1Y5SLS6_9RHOB|nr:HAD family phosphatase [Palleronia marisminoris]SFG87509.1 2-haloacid dehalogenase [Palleronia marisminoris]SLN43129.1 Alpha-D-glucose-1-phosphate phosphatase YihX [Palleronia marisminoris]
MAVDLVVFDIGRVLLEWDPEGYYDKAMGHVARVRLFREVPLHEMNLRIDAGEPWHKTVEDTASKHARWQKDVLGWRDHWNKMAGPLIPESVSLLRALRSKGIPVWALTNFGRETFEYAQSLWPALTEFDGMVVSGHLGVVKPSPEIYAVLERDTGVAPDRILYTDDSAPNIRAAEARGWKTHLFDGPAGLRQRFVDEGLLSPAEARAG